MNPTLAVISGFLGAGKTTLSTNLISYLWEKDMNAALVTNDQSSGLVDSEIASAGGVNVKEISGGCFCCRCDEFALALDEIVALRESDIIIAEAVGSCTDLVATVVEPLRVDLQKPYRVLPVVVVVDPDRAEVVLMEPGSAVPAVGDRSEGDSRSGGIPAAVHETRSGNLLAVDGSFDQALRAVGTAAGMPVLLGSLDSQIRLHDDVTYIFLKQMEEAQVILVNKADAVEPTRMARIVSAIEARCPEADVMGFSAQSTADIARLWEYLQATEARHRPIQEIDYARYAKGEAMLGWLNAECRVSGGVSMDALSDAIGEAVYRRQVERGVEIAHLKVSVVELVGEGKGTGISVVQCVSSAAGPIAVRRCATVVPVARVLINLRAQGAAEDLTEDVQAAVASVTKRLGVKVEVVRLDSFAPGAPNPPYQRRQG